MTASLTNVPATAQSGGTFVVSVTGIDDADDTDGVAKVKVTFGTTTTSKEYDIVGKPVQ